MRVLHPTYTGANSNQVRTHFSLSDEVLSDLRDNLHCTVELAFSRPLIVRSISLAEGIRLDGWKIGERPPEQGLRKWTPRPRNKGVRALTLLLSSQIIGEIVIISDQLQNLGHTWLTTHLMVQVRTVHVFSGVP